jgi:hypothetical protein
VRVRVEGSRFKVQDSGLRLGLGLGSRLGFKVRVRDQV